MRLGIAALLLAFPIVVTATGVAQNAPGPLDVILEVLDAIGKRTSAIERQVTDQSTGLPAIQGSVSKLDAGVGDVGSRIERLLDDVAGLSVALDQLRVGVQRPAPSAHRLWASPLWAASDTGGGRDPHIIAPSRIVVLNPGHETTTVRCLFFNADGVLLLEAEERLTIGPGATAVCTSPAPRRRGRDPIARGWVLVASDRPVLPDGSTLNPFGGDWFAVKELAFYPVDCGNPEGVEFLCAFDGAAP
jgi:hypothetical protein